MRTWLVGLSIFSMIGMIRLMSSGTAWTISELLCSSTRTDPRGLPSLSLRNSCRFSFSLSALAYLMLITLVTRGSTSLRLFSNARCFARFSKVKTVMTAPSWTFSRFLTLRITSSASSQVTSLTFRVTSPLTSSPETMLTFPCSESSRKTALISAF